MTLLDVVIPTALSMVLSCTTLFSVQAWQRRKDAKRLENLKRAKGLLPGHPRPLPPPRNDLEVVFDYWGERNAISAFNILVNDCHARAVWLTENGYRAEVVLLDDRTVRYQFTDAVAATHFKMMFVQ